MFCALRAKEPALVMSNYVQFLTFYRHTNLRFPLIVQQAISNKDGVEDFLIHLFVLSNKIPEYFYVKV
jgi:hypothetical protein